MRLCLGLSVRVKEIFHYFDTSEILKILTEDLLWLFIAVILSGFDKIIY